MTPITVKPSHNMRTEEDQLTLQQSADSQHSIQHSLQVLNECPSGCGGGGGGGGAVGG